ncbi:hypothetical protein J6590_081487 [Homalodisca vitripennis]|nr:hypothetical protein J6590_081487 [Homalodisca vitripennis]
MLSVATIDTECSNCVLPRLAARLPRLIQTLTLCLRLSSSNPCQQRDLDYLLIQTLRLSLPSRANEDELLRRRKR